MRLRDESSWEVASKEDSALIEDMLPLTLRAGVGMEWVSMGEVTGLVGKSAALGDV